MSNAFEHIFFCWAVGVFFAIFLFILIKFLSIKDKVYLVYALYILLAAVYCLSQNDVYFQEFLNSSFQGVPIKAIFVRLIMPLFTVVYFIFAKLFFDSRKKMVNVYRIMDFNIRMFSMHFVIMLAWLFLGYKEIFMAQHDLLYAVGLITISLIFIIAFKYMNRLMAFVYLGSFILFFGNTFFSLSILDMYPLHAWISPFVFLTICILVEIGVFLMGLGYREFILVQNLNKTKLDNISALEARTKMQQAIGDAIKKELIIQTKIIEKQKKKEVAARFDAQIGALQIKALHSQMNPHFLFNSLNTLKLMVLSKDWSKIETYFNDFTSLLRKILKHSKSEKITLEAELDAISLYLSLERERFSLAFDYKLTIEENINLKSITIPPMLIQPFIENAIWHGLLPLKNRLPLLEIDICLKAQILLIEIKDNGVGRNTQKQKRKLHQSLGMTMIDERIDILNKLEKENPISIEIMDLVDQATNPLGTNIRLSFKVKNS